MVVVYLVLLLFAAEAVAALLATTCEKDEAVLNVTANSSFLWSPVLNNGDSRVPEFVLVVSTHRSASTEVAETAGGHPCSASWNEILKNAHFPSGYTKYKHGTYESYKKYLGVHSLNHDRLLEQARRKRDKFCDGRPQSVRDFCGQACAIVLKVHLDSFGGHNNKEQWHTLLGYNGSLPVFVERNASEAFCSIEWAKTEGSYAHSPEKHKKAGDKRPPCERTADNEDLMDDFEKRVRRNIVLACFFCVCCLHSGTEPSFKSILVSRIAPHGSGTPAICRCARVFGSKQQTARRVALPEIHSRSRRGCPARVYSNGVSSATTTLAEHVPVSVHVRT